MQKIIFTGANGESIEFCRSGYFRLRSIDPNSISTQITSEKSVGMDGVHTSEITYNARTIPCGLTLYGIDENGRYSTPQAQKMWQKVTRVFAPHKAGTLLFINDTGRYKIDCYAQELPNPARKVGARYDFQIDLIADWPFWEDECAQSVTVTNGQTTIYNNSGLDMPFCVEASGAFSTLTVCGCGKKIDVNQNVDAGETLVIDTKKRTAKIGDQTAGYKLSFDSEYFRLPPGASTLTVSCAQSVTIRFAQIYLGV